MRPLFLKSWQASRGASRRGQPRQQHRGQHTAARAQQLHAPGGPPAAAGASSSGSGFSWAKWVLLPPAAAALLGSVAYAFSANQQQRQLEEVLAHSRISRSPAPWVADVEKTGAVKVMTAEMLLEDAHPFMEDDHMFSAFVAKGIVEDIAGYYDRQERKFYAVVSLGREVCGFPRIVHGGLTAAIVDESFGGLLFALKQAGGLGFWGPAYTVNLEVAYKAKIQAGRTILCTTEVESCEGRKLWMKATVSDGPKGQVYATARALFVAPKPHKMVQDVGKYLLRRLVGDM